MRKKEGTVNYLVWFGRLLGIFLIDRLTKSFFLSHSRTVVNQGISWGVASTFSPALVALFSALIFALCLLLLFSFLKSLGLWLITFGGFSNLLDRIFYGGVVDFINLPWLPAFNFADIVVCFGGLLLLVDFLRTGTIS